MASNQHEIEDVEANLFARCLLMPEDMVRQEVRKLASFDLCNDSHVEVLAKKFRVPVSLMAFRIGELYGEARPL